MILFLASDDARLVTAERRSFDALRQLARPRRACAQAAAAERRGREVAAEVTAVAGDVQLRRTYRVSLMALHAAEDKTYPGANVAGWGVSVAPATSLAAVIVNEAPGSPAKTIASAPPADHLSDTTE